MSPEEFQAEVGVSRETLDRLRAYEAVLQKWQRNLNLVSAATLRDVWRRHFLDSAQLQSLLPAGTRMVLDIGSGGGFPGLVLAILGVGQVHLVESDQRKAAFLREVARATGATNCVFHVKRVETLRPEDLGSRLELVTARALAPVSQILAWTESLADPSTTYVLPVGRGEALTDARKTWTMTVEAFPSRTEPDSKILRIRDVSRG